MELLKALTNVSHGMLLGVMLLGQMQDGWVLHPFRTPCFILVVLMIILQNISFEKFKRWREKVYAERNE